MKRITMLGLVLACAAMPALATDVNLTLQAPASAMLGDIVPVMLIADADTTGLDVCTMEVILNWDPAVLRLLGVDTTGAFPWFVSDFLPGSLNTTFEDGDALYTALNPTAATLDTGGLLVTTFEFEVLQGTRFSDIEIVASQGSDDTTVFLCTPPSTPATLGSTTNVTIQQVPTVSEWGLIVMTLLGMVGGTLVFARRSRVVMAGMSASDVQPLPLFAPAVFAKALIVCLALAAAGIAVATTLTGPLSVVDTSGTLLCTVIAAYLAHLWAGLRRG